MSFPKYVTADQVQSICNGILTKRDFVTRTDLVDEVNRVVDPKLQELERRMRIICDERIAVFAAELYASMRAGNTEVADMVDAMRQAMSGNCDNDLTNDVKNVSMLKSEAVMLQALRSRNQDAYLRLAQASQTLADGDPLKRGTQAAALADGLMALYKK
jgi:hypothetical protein